MLFYGEHSYGFSESDFMKMSKNPINFTTSVSMSAGHGHSEVF